MASARLEQRVAALEAEVAKLKSKQKSRRLSNRGGSRSRGRFRTILSTNTPCGLGSNTASRYVPSRRHVRSSNRTMVVLDTDHMSALERREQPGAVPLRARLAPLPPEVVVTTISSYEEQMRGWMAYLAQRRSVRPQPWFSNGSNALACGSALWT
jgi:hypothetical protein